MSNEMVPFGKHKGKPLDALLDDREYLDWLLKQGWFQQQYGNIYQIVINNGQEPTETPEHNAMQIKFLDKLYRLKFAYIAKGESVFKYATNEGVRASMQKFLSQYRAAQSEYLKELEAWKRENLPNVSHVGAVTSYSEAMKVNTNVRDEWARDWDMYKARISERLAILATVPANERCAYDLAHEPQPPALAPSAQPLSMPGLQITFTDYWWGTEGGYEDDDFSAFFGFESPIFEEEGIDVVYEILTGLKMFTCWPGDRGLGRNTDTFSIKADIDSTRDLDSKYVPGLHFRKAIAHPKLSSTHKFKIEIKPSIGDDYPAVLRQMKRNKAEYLLIGQYRGIGATKEQFVKFFEAQDIKVIFEADVEAAQLPRYDEDFTEIELPPFEQGEL